MKSVNPFIVLLILFFSYSCGTSKNISTANSSDEEILTQDIVLNEIVIEPDTPSYKAAETRLNDLIHMNLSVEFDWKKRSVLGTSVLSFSPYFYPTSELILDAKGMEIKSVGMKNKNFTETLESTYDGKFLRINLAKTYTKKDVYIIEIIYEAFPQNITSEGSSAITMAQGIYFINPDSTEVNKPTQIWTQGETEANSVWFPTIDSPNERMSQEIQITVNEKYKTLSNGELMFSNYNSDGTRTDYWKQDLPHAPYLVMLAIGDFAVISDSWVNSENEEIVVDYFMEPEYAPYAKDIFGNTPEMLSFYSEVLGYPYPWDKYSQVIVRDFVSGAMENTSAVIHGDFLNSTKRELLDSDNEDVIAHELFHHWFGDLVTCESWSNLPLNESFATYGEYLWIEHKYGRDAADLHGFNSMNGYLAESQTKQENLIRFYYDDKEDMFDGHSYNKGGRVLHMLRYFLGDDAFFTGLQLYLNENEFEAVEIHQLRLAMEEISGKDLNWFFNQWFLGSGHPNLIINYDVNDSLNTVNIKVEQTQDKLFRLPLHVEVFTSYGSFRSRLDIRQRSQTFNVDTDGEELLFVNFDADKVLLGTKQDNRPTGWLKPLFENGSLFLDRHEALEAALDELPSEAQEIINAALSDDFWKIRHLALSGAKHLDPLDKQAQKQIEQLANNDPKSLVRAKALKTLIKTYASSDYSMLIDSAFKDPSYSVMSVALKLLANADVIKGLNKARELEAEKSSKITNEIASIYAKHGTAPEHSFFQTALSTTNGFSKYTLLSSYSKYLINQDEKIIKEGVSVLASVAENENTWWIRASAYGGLVSILTSVEDNSIENNDPPSTLAQLIRTNLDELLSKESNEQILDAMSDY